MIEIKTLEICNMMPVESDLWFLNRFTNRDYTIYESEKPCRECGGKLYAKDEYEHYCNHCGLVKERKYISNSVYNGFTHDMKVLKNRSTHLKTIETQIIRIEPDYNKQYRDFKHRYYNLFISIANKDYYIDKSTANDLFYNYFRGFYDLNNRRGLKREKLIKRFLDRISINPREYFMVGQSVNSEDNKALVKDLMGGSRIPVISEGQINVTGKKFTGRKIGYQKYLDVNQFEDNPAIRMKYIKRYMEDSVTLLNIKYSFTPEDYNQDSVASPVTTIPTLNEDYVPFNSLGLEDMVINTVQYPSRSKYHGLDVEKDSMIQELKKKQAYYSTNLNTYTYTNKPETKQLTTKTVNDPQKNTENKSEIKTIGGTSITKKMNQHPYKNKIYYKSIGKRRHCHNCGQIFITTKHRQLYCSHCYTINTQ